MFFFFFFFPSFRPPTTGSKKKKRGINPRSRAAFLFRELICHLWMHMILCCSSRNTPVLSRSRSQRRGTLERRGAENYKLSDCGFCARRREGESEPLPARMSHDLWPWDRRRWAEALPSFLVIPAVYSQVTPALRCWDFWGVNQDEERLQICGGFSHRRGPRSRLIRSESDGLQRKRKRKIIWN